MGTGHRKNVSPNRINDEMAANANAQPRKPELPKEQLSALPKSKTPSKLASPTPFPKSEPIQPKLKSTLKIVCWNIRRGIVTRELELKNLLKEEDIDIMFLTEVDTRAITTKNDYQVEGYVTMLPKIRDGGNIVRVLCLVKNEIQERVKLLEHFMSEDFSSIWLEYTDLLGAKTNIGGFYREWTCDGLSSESDQAKRLETLLHQFDLVTENCKRVIVLGDANISLKKIKKDSPLKNKRVTELLMNKLEECGLISLDIGDTFTSDIIQKNGKRATSDIDHIYVSKKISERTEFKTLDNSSTDHLPIMATLTVFKQTVQKMKTITKRSTKFYTKARWTKSLAKQEWEDLGLSEDLDEMTTRLAQHVTTSLDECAPRRTFKVRNQYKHGITEKTKQLIRERDNARKQITGKSQSEKIVQQMVYKKLRNRVISELRNDNINFNNERVKSAKDENEMWKVVKDITSPRSSATINLIEDGKIIEDEKEVADVFNSFFVEKIKDLNIDHSMVEDPCTRLREKMEPKKLKFSLKKITEKTVLKAIKGMKNKKSSGLDEITQEQLKAGAEILAIPLTRIINASIEQGKFPDDWKEGIVTPILKKGATTDKKNYRPVTCLSVLSKVMEKVICDQITKYMETNNLLPPNQHGFRARRSTMTALSTIQQEWAENTVNKFITGVLLWDLSAAFDTLNTSTLCKKLQIYGFDRLSCAWFRSFLTGRSQRVKIGITLSNKMMLTSGVPQGGILSPIIFVIYGADMELWLMHSSALTYADDTSSSVKDKRIEEVVRKLEEDAINVLKFMASNGLVANPSKTTLLILNNRNGEEIEIKIGETKIKQDKEAKLLGVKIQDDQKWKVQIEGIGGVVSSLNQRQFLVRRMQNHLSKEQVRKVAESIWTSKLRYGLQLYGEVRKSISDPTTSQFDKLQKAQNNLMRTLENVRVKDKISIKKLLETTKMMSVNQTQAQIKLVEMWKSKNIDNYPIKPDKITVTENGTSTRSATAGCFRLNETPSTFIGDATRLWNQAAVELKSAKTLKSAKELATKFAKELPI